MDKISRQKPLYASSEVHTWKIILSFAEPELFADLLASTLNIGRLI